MVGGSGSAKAGGEWQSQVSCTLRGSGRAKVTVLLGGSGRAKLNVLSEGVAEPR